MTRVKKPHDTVILERRFFAGGTCVFREGDEGSSAYLIQSGSVHVYSTHNDKKVILATLEAGNIFGEISLICNVPRSASIEAAEDCNLIVLTRQSLKDKMDQSDPTIQALIKMLIKRVQHGNDSLMNKNVTYEDVKESLMLVYENILKALPSATQVLFREDVLPLIEKVNTKMGEYKDMIK
jgi:CRP-like cAMP-binding protein